MNNVQTEFDVIIIGGGINGLTTACYLAKVGLKTLVIERRDQVGTHSATEEWSYPGFRTSPHATSHWIGHSPCMMDLDLERFGLELYPARYTDAMVFKNGKALVPDAWDVNKYHSSILKFSEHDAKVFKDLFNALIPLQAQLWQDFVYAPPSIERWDWFVAQMGKLPHVPEDWWNMTGFEMADLLFEDDQVKAWKVTLAQAITYPANQKIIGPMGALLTGATLVTQQALGGSHQVPHAMIRCLIHYGGKVLQSCEVEKIIIEDGEAKGVILGKDSAYPEKRLLARRAIISNLSPVPTFVELIGEDHIDKQVIRFLKYEYDYDRESLFSASFMTDAPPTFNGKAFDPKIQEAWSFFCGVECMEDVEKAMMQLDAGRIPEPITALGKNFVLSLHDETSAPPGYHNVQFWLDVPYNLRKMGGAEKWDEISPDIMEKTVEMAEQYAPGFRKSIKYQVALNPLDTFRKNPSALLGTRHGGVTKPGQLYFDKPFLGCNAPRTPIKKLYLSNGIWPFNNTVLAPAYICASVVAQDLVIPKPDWWSHKVGDWFSSWVQKNGMQSQVNRRFAS